MHVVATAGHVDHGKSTLVRALTGTDPDRLEEEHRRGLSIELGYAWTELPGAGTVAFVDVPGHERFLATMLAGVGPVPAALLVVAADDPWMPQAAEHLAALDALGVEHGVVAVSRADLADPANAAVRARSELIGTTLEKAPIVPVSAVTGQGMDELRDRLAEMVLGLPDPDHEAPVRIWIDRRFSIRGAGAVVTGTLPAGTVRVGDELAADGVPLRVRGLQSLGRPVAEASGVARVALNLTGDDLSRADRGGVLVTPAGWLRTDLLDVRVVSGGDGRVPERPLLHVGATSVAVRVRPLAESLLRLRLERPLPLAVGDRILLRDPGSRRLWGADVLDPLPPPLRRRGSARARAETLRRTRPGQLADELQRREVVRLDVLRRIGVPVGVGDIEAAEAVTADGWVMGRDRARRAADQVRRAVADHEATSALKEPLPLTVLADRVGLPTPGLVAQVVAPPLQVRNGRVSGARQTGLPAEVRKAVDAVLADLAENPFAAPSADRLRELGLDNSRVAAAAKAGLVFRPAPGIVLGPQADRAAVVRLRQQLGTSRRVVLPLLEHLDRAGLTRRLPDDRREVTGR